MNRINLGGGNSNILDVHPIFGEDFQSEEYIFQMA